MHSESMRRLHVEHPSREPANREARERIQRETEQFLAGGGLVKTIPRTSGKNPTWAFNIGNGENLSIAKHPELAPDREWVDGVLLVRKRVVADMVGIAVNTIDRWIRQKDFPPPRRVGRCARWVESEVAAWVAARGDSYIPRRSRI